MRPANFAACSFRPFRTCRHFQMFLCSQLCFPPQANVTRPRNLCWIHNISSSLVCAANWHCSPYVVLRAQCQRVGRTSLTSGISWTFVVDGFSSWSSLPRHEEEVLVFAYLMRSCRSKWEADREVKGSRHTEKEKSPHTNSHRLK